MPAGLQVFNADGTLQFDSNNVSLLRGLFAFEITGSDGSLALPTGTSGTREPIVTSAQVNLAVPSIQISGNTVSWTYGTIPPAYRGSCTVLVVIH